MPSPVFVLDVAHPPLRADTLDAVLDDAWGTVRNSPTLRILKVVHGYGSTGKGGTIRESTRNWAYRHRARFSAVIPGEAFSLFDETTRAMRDACGQFEDPDLHAANPGMTIVWVK